MTEQALGRIMDADFATELLRCQAKSKPGCDFNVSTGQSVKVTATSTDTIK